MSMQSKNYQNYLLEDFIWDEDFRNWVNQPTPLSERYWNEWLIDNPDKKRMVDAAKQIIQSIRIHEPEINDRDIDNQIKKILAQTNANPDNISTGNEVFNEQPERQVLLLRRNRLSIIKVAAVFVAFASIGLLLYYYFSEGDDKLQRIASGYGVTKKIILPDSSIIVLNGNSSINYNKTWKTSMPREVWLNGEGYFDVKHLNKTNQITPGERFIVHVKNLNVEVLGTSFDIRQRRDKIWIVLNTGSIKVSVKDKPDLIMRPGDIVTFFNSGADSVIVSKTEPNMYNSWTEKKLMVSNTSANEVFQYLEDNYGKKIILSDKSIATQKLEGTIMLGNLNDALFVLSEVLNVHVINTDSVIMITKIKK